MFWLLRVCMYLSFLKRPLSLSTNLSDECGSIEGEVDYVCRCV